MLFHIETERLIMRDLLPTDDAGMFALDSDPDVHRYLGNKPIHTIDEARKVIDFIREQYVTRGIGRWAVIEKATGNFIGWSGLKFMTDTVNGHTNYYDLGYRFIKQYWGKGYATETAIATAQYGWDVLNLSVINGTADLNNVASRNVLEKIGMQYINTYDYSPEITCAWYELSLPKQ